MKAQIEQYLATLRARNCSPHTLRAYVRALGEMADHFGSLDNINRPCYRALLTKLLARLGHSSRDHAQRIHRSFFRWLEAEGILTSAQNPTEGIRAIRRAKQLVRVPSAEQVQALLDGPMTGSTNAAG